jgi:hypothetical protein
MTAMRAAADARIFAFGVLTHDHPVEVAGLASLERCIDAGEYPCRAQVGVLVEALADRQTQPPQRDVIRNVGIAGRTEEDRILITECRQAIGRHHDAVRAVVVAAPVEVLEIETQRVVGAPEPAAGDPPVRLPCRSVSGNRGNR